MLSTCIQRAARAQSSSSLRGVSRQSWNVSRSLHASSIASKKKSNKATEDSDDLFDDLFDTGSGGGIESNALRSQAKAPGSMGDTGAPTDAQRAQNFEDLRATIAYRCDRKAFDIRRRDAPRLNSIAKLVSYAATTEQLNQVTDSIALWRQSGRAIDSHTANIFIKRCIYLKRPDVVLKVLGSRPKYGLDLPSLTTARCLMQSISQNARQPSADCPPFTDSYVNDALLLAGLYPQFGLPEISQEPVSALLLIGICGSTPEPSENVTTLLNALKTFIESPDFERHLQAKAFQSFENPGLQKAAQDKSTGSSNSSLVDQLSMREQTWVRQTIKTVTPLVQSQGIEDKWLQSLDASM